MKQLFLLSLVFLCASCDEKESQTFFKQQPISKTGITFRNTLRESAEFNVLNYSYFYNGGGVAIGDVNNDDLPDIYLTGNMVASHLYINEGDWKFREMAAPAGTRAEGLWNTGVTMADVNGDGWLDIYVCRSAANIAERRQNVLFINNGLTNGQVSFTEMAAQVGLNDDGYSTQAAFFDYDQDGDLDMYLLNHSVPEYADFSRSSFRLKNRKGRYFGDKLFRNDQGSFTNVSEEAGILQNVLGFGLGISIADFNQDYWPDIYVSNDFNEEDYLYLNKKDGTFQETLAQSMDHVSMFSMGSDASDINNDGLTDLITLDMLPSDNYRNKLSFGPDHYDKYQVLVDQGFHPQSMRNMLQLNEGGGTFREVGRQTGISATDWSWSALIGDYDLDGWQDLFVTNGYLRDYTNMDFLSYLVDQKLKTNATGAVVEVEDILEAIPEIAVSNKFFLNEEGQKFKDKSNESGFTTIELSNGASYADLDADGDLDLVVNNINQAASIYRNMTQEREVKNWLKILPENVDGTLALGATIELFSENRHLKRELFLSRGYQSSVEPLVHFGLGSDPDIDSLVVHWPSGANEFFPDTEINKLVRIRQGTGKSTMDISTLVEPYFQEELLLEAKHTEDDFNDFKVQSLIPSFHSRAGPPMVTGDIDGDGKSDLILGGARNQESQIFLNKSGKWMTLTSLDILQDAKYEDVAILLIDPDQDNDLDLLIASGGNYSENINSYPLRFYLNDGHGNYSRINNSDTFQIMASCLTAGDFDGDGDQDIFVGSGYTPWNYPIAAENLMLENQGDGTFSKMEDLPFASEMITSASLTSIAADGRQDLITVGEWEPIKIWTFHQNNWTLRWQSQQKGWFSSVHVANLDDDPAMEAVVGNIGLNTPFYASNSAPITLYYGDFDQNGTIDPIFTSYSDGMSFPFISRDDLIGQLPGLKKEFPDYKTYAATNTRQLLSMLPGNYETKEIQYLKTCVLDLAGDSMRLVPLPSSVQSAPIYCINSLDVNSDGNLDLFLAGNHTFQRVKTGPLYANHGVLLKNNGRLNFTTVSAAEAGIDLQGDVRSCVTLKNQGDHFLVVGINDVGLKSYRIIKQDLN